MRLLAGVRAAAARLRTSPSTRALRRASHRLATAVAYDPFRLRRGATYESLPITVQKIYAYYRRMDSRGLVQGLVFGWHWLYRRYCACVIPLFAPQSGDSCLLRVSALGHLLFVFTSWYDSTKLARIETSCSEIGRIQLLRRKRACERLESRWSQSPIASVRNLSPAQCQPLG
ncbi:hypothetical protein EVAR_74772_1 [Eumeta japonica]|uniref:Uncharacterized protein n=1 Tax=Eumeta variegata TaxID=151549 RepID=A0A4C1SRN3_EUMVA|nr:hypothetical protein EVAR_74772_1 [Eumeta japonica]